jgi:hypothetical protein
MYKPKLSKVKALEMEKRMAELKKRERREDGQEVKEAVKYEQFNKPWRLNMGQINRSASAAVDGESISES